ncbi:hypothetical protein FJT64_024794 [Amphibalanus amphitrite]|uniref:Uncharacterized protein n=1 Tax=Amphibalanus amphitrite TaxID=1232801 RepID=A0A6A4W5T0_AMPAM|nr:hypothetical protein FJT64_024794 [Amphibalanus amphitrite]
MPQPGDAAAAATTGSAGPAVTPDLTGMKTALLALLGDQEIVKTLREVFGVDQKEKELQTLKEEVAAQKLIIEQQEERLHDLEQYSKRNCLNFTGVPENPDENTLQLAVDLAKMANVSLHRTDLDRAHRIGAPKPAAPGQPRPPPRPLVVKFISYQKREAVWFGRRDLRKAIPPRGSSLPEGSGGKVFVQENLTRRNQELMFEARQLKRAGKLWAVWSDGCVPKAKKTQQAPTVRLRSKADLRQFE